MAEITFIGPGNFRTNVTHVRQYSDSTPMIKMDNFAEIVEKADTMVLRPKSLSSFVEAMFLMDAIDIAEGGIEYLILPYIPGARQDRSNPTGDVLFTLASVADMINRRMFDTVLVLDPHSPAATSPAVGIDNAVEYPLERVAAKMPPGYTGIIAADKGGRDRAKKFADAMGLPIFFGGKTRDVSTGKLTGFILENLNYDGLHAGGHFLVVDDICDGGGTFIGLGEKIKEQSASADLFVTHGIFSKGSTNLRKVYKNVITTDSRDIIHTDNILTIPIMEDMERYL